MKKIERITRLIIGRRQNVSMVREAGREWATGKTTTGRTNVDEGETQ